MSETPKPSVCPKCGAVLVQEFAYQRINDIADYAMPTGKYSCARCAPFPVREPLQEKPQ